MSHPLKEPATAQGRRAIERVRKICLALPGATEKLAWGEPTWRAHGRMFAQMDTHHHGAEHVAVWLPMPEGAQDELVADHPEHCFVPPYVGHKGWVAVRVDRKPDWPLVTSLVQTAYRHVERLKAGTRPRAPSTRRAWAPWRGE